MISEQHDLMLEFFIWDYHYDIAYNCDCIIGLYDITLFSTAKSQLL